MFCIDIDLTDAKKAHAAIEQLEALQSHKYSNEIEFISEIETLTAAKTNMETSIKSI